MRTILCIGWSSDPPVHVAYLMKGDCMYCNFWVLRCIIFKCSKKYTNDHNANIKTIAAGMASTKYRVYVYLTFKLNMCVYKLKKKYYLCSGLYCWSNGKQLWMRWTSAWIESKEAIFAYFQESKCQIANIYRPVI